MSRAFYSDTIEDFQRKTKESIVGALLNNYTFSVLAEQKIV